MKDAIDTVLDWLVDDGMEFLMVVLVAAAGTALSAWIVMIAIAVVGWPLSFWQSFAAVVAVRALLPNGFGDGGERS